MKKSLIALAALAATGAFAQSSVTLYGRLDVGYVNQTTQETQNNGQANTQNLMGGSNNGLQTSYWGIKGTEDLGGGLKANFNLESDVTTATGATGGTVGGATSTGAFNRISTVGLEGNFGRVDIGRYYTPFFLNGKSGDVNDASSILTTWNLTSYNAVGGVAPTANISPVLAAIANPHVAGAFGTTSAGGADVRNNGIHYLTPNWGGFSARIMFAPGDNTANVNQATGTATGANASNNGLSAAYANGPLYVGYAWGEQVSKASLSAADSRGNGQNIAVSYDFGAAKVFANWGRTKTQIDTRIESYNEKSETNIGVAVPFGKVTVTAAYGRNTFTQTTTGAEAANLSGNDWTLGATYDLSKRTALYAKSGVVQKYEGTVGNTAADTKTTGTMVGVRHLF